MGIDITDKTLQEVFGEISVKWREMDEEERKKIVKMISDVVGIYK